MIVFKVKFMGFMAGGFLALAGLAYAQAPVSSPTPSSNTAPASILTDAQIAGIVETANKAEIEAGKLAEKRSTTKEVKDFGKMMVKEHDLVNKGLKKLAKRLKIKPADSEMKSSLMAAGKDSEAKLKSLKGADFDKAYAADQVKMHQTVLESIDSALLPNAKQEDLKTMLTNVRASVATHLDKAKALQNTVGPTM